MADSLLFDGNDGIDFVGTNIPNIGPATVVLIEKHTTSGVKCWIDQQWNITAHFGDTFGFWSGAADFGGPTLSSDVWRLLAITKAAGTDNIRFHTYNYDTDTWGHQDSSGTTGDINGSGDLHIGYNGSGDNITGNLLVAGIWDSEFADAALEALGLELGLQEWHDANPFNAWRFDTVSAISDFGTNGTADEISRTGTAVDTGVIPAGWDDTLGGGGVTVKNLAALGAG